MMLRASVRGKAGEYNLEPVTGGNEAGDSGVPHSEILVALAEAVVVDYATRLTDARLAALDVLGGDGLVDAIAVAGYFDGIDRVADATGIPVDDYIVPISKEIRESLGIDEFAQTKERLELEIDQGL